jgi:hypothetical protein
VKNLGKKLGLLDIVAVIDGLVGLDCSAITVVGASSTHCAQQTVCCTGNSFVRTFFIFIFSPTFGVYF